MRHQVRMVATGIGLALIGVAVGVSPGCTKCHHFEVRGVVRSAADGRPLAGVNVEADTGSTYVRSGLPATSAADGSFAFTFCAADGQFHGDIIPQWTATLSRDGHVPEVVKFGPLRQPKGGEPPTQIVLVVYLRQ